LSFPVCGNRVRRRDRPDFLLLVGARRRQAVVRQCRSWPMAGAQTAEIGGILLTFQGGLERQVWGGQFGQLSVT